MRAFCLRFAVVFLLIGWGAWSGTKSGAQTPASAQPAAAQAKVSSAQAGQAVPPDDPVADPKAVVTVGHARFTVLTPQLIRMEWSATGKFEDHASLVFINRRLPASKFVSSVTGEGANRTLTIKTEDLTLTYAPTGDGQFTADDLKIEVRFDGTHVVWHPGLVDDGNLQGTTRTLDGALGSKTQQVENREGEQYRSAGCEPSWRR